MSDLLQIEGLPGETRAFLWRRDELQGLAIERGGELPRAGDRLLCRVRALDRRLQGAFVALPAGPDGFLPLNSAPGLSEGQRVTVRVKRAASEDQGPLLTHETAAPAADDGPVPRWLTRGQGPLEALLAQGTEIACDDPARAQALRARGLAVTHLPGGFPPADQARQDAALESLLEPRVPLAGGELLIEAGRTLTAIDVNLGAADPRGFQILAAAEIGRQVLLRNLAGRFVVDFLAGAREADDAAIRDQLRLAFAGDPARVKLIGWSRGGLYEFTRRRLHPALPDLLLEPAAYGGWRKQPLTLALEAVRAFDRARRAEPARCQALVLRADLLALLRDHPALAWLAERAGRPVALRPGGPEPWRLELETPP